MKQIYVVFDLSTLFISRRLCFLDNIIVFVT